MCGAGNNGGDGYVAARVLAEQGRTPRVLEPRRLERQSPESKANRDLCLAGGIELDSDPAGLLLGCDLIVDAVFGVGLARPVGGEDGETFHLLAASGLPIVSVDLPSGVSSETGLALGAALEPACIVTLGLPKLGLALQPSAARVLVADIGLPQDSVERANVRQHLLTRAAARALLPPRPAARATRAPSATRSSSAERSARPAPRSSPRSARCAPASASSRRRAARAGVDLRERAARAHVRAARRRRRRRARRRATSTSSCARPRARDALVLGPGLGQREGAAAVARALATRAGVAAVIDADALNAFAGEPEALRARRPGILTPHPGEARGCSAAPRPRSSPTAPAAARALAARANAVVVLKGARTVVAAPDGALSINPTGGPGLAAGGSGDVLAGSLGALLARGLSGWDAARLGVYLHGLAGDLGPAQGGLAERARRAAAGGLAGPPSTASRAMSLERSVPSRSAERDPGARPRARHCACAAATRCSSRVRSARARPASSRAWREAWRCRAEAAVTSPTFVLVAEYPGRVWLRHADFYRVETYARLLDAGFDDLQGPDGVLVVEWPERFPEALPAERLELPDRAGRGRCVASSRFTARGARAQELLKELEATWA